MFYEFRRKKIFFSCFDCAYNHIHLYCFSSSWLSFVVIIVTTMPNAFYAYDPIIVCLYDKTPEWVACMHTACIPAYKIRQQQQRQRHRFRCEWKRRDLMPLHTMRPTMELWRDAVDCIASRCTHLFKCYVHESPKAETLTLAQLSCTLHSIRWIFQNLSSLFCT